MSNLDGINFFPEKSITEVLRKNIYSFLTYGLLEIGGFINGEAVLSAVSATGISPNTLYQGGKDDWVWEQNISLKFGGGSQPLSVTGIRINNVTYPTGSMFSGSYYGIDYNQGQVVFTSGLSDVQTISVARSLRYISVYDNNDFQDKEMTYDWINNNSIFNQIERMYLPAITFDITSKKTLRGLHLGSRSKIIDANIEFNVFATSKSDLDKITDLLYMLEEKTIKLYDPSSAPKPLNYKGELINSTLTYPYLIENYPFEVPAARFMQNARVDRVIKKSSPILRNRVNISLELDFNPK